MSEPTLRDQLLADYMQHEDAVELAANAELWELADWLADYVPPSVGGRPPKGVTQVTPFPTLADLAQLGRRSRNHLSNLRKTAIATRRDRMPQITPRSYQEALVRTGWDLMAANERLRQRGRRLRDQTGKMESVAALQEGLGKRTAEERAAVAAELMTDPTVADLIGDHDPWSFGKEWADNFVVRLHENAFKLTTQVRKHGLRFSPSSELSEWLRYLSEAEHEIAEVRAAVQERINDQRVEVS